ncbi:MAG: alginate lyase family protein, partial [Verrucomicrobiota bacterium]|nr:alginate lyase family protein [Verrucomicrobiota bacterium]
MDRFVNRFFLLPSLFLCSVSEVWSDKASFDLLSMERPRILAKAKTYLSEKPRTVTADRCERSEGDAHDFYSEGDYWWPNPEDPDGPYVRRDGETNP